MQSGQETLEQARASYEEHMRTCRLCADGSSACQASKLLRRTYNNLVRKTRKV